MSLEPAQQAPYLSVPYFFHQLQTFLILSTMQDTKVETRFIRDFATRLSVCITESF